MRCNFLKNLSGSLSIKLESPVNELLSDPENKSISYNIITENVILETSNTDCARAQLNLDFVTILPIVSSFDTPFNGFILFNFLLLLLILYNIRFQGSRSVLNILASKTNFQNLNPLALEFQQKSEHFVSSNIENFHSTLNADAHVFVPRMNSNIIDSANTDFNDTPMPFRNLFESLYHSTLNPRAPILFHLRTQMILLMVSILLRRFLTQ